jgi:hypothetical protein
MRRVRWEERTGSPCMHSFGHNRCRRRITDHRHSYQPQGFPPLLRQAMEIINPFVNDILSPPPCSDRPGSDPDISWRKDARGGLAGPKRYKLEYDGPWRANVAAVNCYAGGESA